MQEIRRLPLVVRVGPRHPLYSKPDVRAEDFSRYIYVDSPNSSYLKNNEFLAAIRPNLNRIVRTASAESKLRLVAASDSMYSVGAQLPQYLNKRYGFRSIPVGNPDDYILSAVVRKENRSPVAGRYLQLLQEEMNSL